MPQSEAVHGALPPQTPGHTSTAHLEGLQMVTQNGGLSFQVLMLCFSIESLWRYVLPRSEEGVSIRLLLLLVLCYVQVYFTNRYYSRLYG